MLTKQRKILGAYFLPDLYSNKKEMCRNSFT